LEARWYLREKISQTTKKAIAIQIKITNNNAGIDIIIPS